MSAAIEVAGLSYRYHDGTEALRGVSLRIEEGECVGLIGPNGSGKSTLLLHLNGILPDRPGDGSNVRVVGRPVRGEFLDAIRREVGMVFQDPDDQLFCPTVREDVAFGPRQLGLADAEVDRRVREALKQVGLAGYERRATHHLSHGEKRRACIAGVLACSPSVLVLDEPTAGLDPRGRGELELLLRDIPATKLIATHDLGFVAALCSRVILLDHGEIVAHGPTPTLLQDTPTLLAHGLSAKGVRS